MIGRAAQVEPDPVTGVHAPPDVSPIVLGIGAVLLAPPLVLAGYSFLRDDELEPYSGRALWIRAGVLRRGVRGSVGRLRVARRQRIPKRPAGLDLRGAAVLRRGRRQADEANLVAGAHIYSEQCAVCHGYYGKASQFGKDMFPDAPPLWEKHHDGQVVGVSDDPPRRNLLEGRQRHPAHRHAGLQQVSNRQPNVAGQRSAG